MAIEFNCPAGHKLRVPDELAGKTVRCPKCSARVIAPEAGRRGLDVSDSDVRPVEPASRSAGKTARPAPPSKPGSQPRDSKRPEPAGATSPPPWRKWIWLVVGGCAAAALLLMGTGAFVAWRFLSPPQNAAQRTVAENRVVGGGSPEPIKASAKFSPPNANRAQETREKAIPPAADASQKDAVQPAVAGSAPAPAPAPAPLTAQPLSTGRAHEIVQLPAPMQQLVAAGSGKYLVAALPDAGKVAVIDVTEKKLAKLIPVDDTDLVVAAGETKFVVLARGQGIVSRYDLKSLTRELAIACEPYRALAMGSSSEGPLLAVGTRMEAIDLQTLKPIESKDAGNDASPLRSSTNYALNQLNGSVDLRASADGRVFGGWRKNTSPTGMAVLEVDGENIRSTYRHVSEGAIIPSPNGRVIYGGLGRFDLAGQTIRTDVHRNQAGILLPAATGPFCMKWVLADMARHGGFRPSRVTIHFQNDDSPLLTVNDAVLPEFPQNLMSAAKGTLPLEQRLFWMPTADALVSVPSPSDQLVIQHFSLKEELDKGGTDYFQVASVPPRLFQRGQKLSYAIDVLSKRGEVQYTLENGPPGTTVSPQGVVNWDVPSDFAPHEAILLVKLRDGSGQELAHTVKLSDGYSPPPPQQPAFVDRSRRRVIRTRITRSAPTFANRFAGPVTSPPKSMGANLWQWSGGSPVCLRGEKGNFGGVLLGDKLYFLKDNGALATEAVTLPSPYVAAGLRAGGIIGVAANPTRVEILDRHGKLLRKVALSAAAPRGLALHPTKPICYVCLDLDLGPFRGGFVAVDEKAGTSKSGDEDLGQDVVVDPTGRFLVSTYVHSIHLGDQVVVSQAPGVRGRPGFGRFPGRVPVPSGPGPRVTVFHRYTHVAVMLVYDLDQPLAPEFHGFNPLQSVPGPMRISRDGRRLTTLPTGARLAKCSAVNPLDFKASAINYDPEGGQGGGTIGSDVAFHPLLPLSVVVGSGTAAFFDADSGKPYSGKGRLDLPDLANLSVRRAMFSGDGKQLLVLAGGNNGDQTLLRAPLSLTPDQLTALRKRAAAPLKSLKSSALPLADLTGWRGGLAKAATSAQISAEYSDAVVIVRTSNSTGTGFFVGTSGLVLTCAHCVSPLDPVEVVYHLQGKPDEKITAEATIAYRDRKTDLALLKINAKRPLHAVVLADPVDVKSGEDVTIIANPGLGTDVLDNTVTTGIISNVKRTIAGNNYIQSSAAVNPGSSGGPMFDRHGQVIGVVVLKAGIDGVGFAVPPLSIAKFLLRATRRDGKKGQLERSWVDSELKQEIHGSLMDVNKQSVTLLDQQSGQSKSRPLADFSPGDQKLLALIAIDD